MSKNVIIRNVELNYPHLFNAHQPFGEDIWDVQIKTNDIDTLKALKAAGVNMKDAGDGYYQANVKRKVLNRKGEKNKPVSVVDSSKNPWDPDTGIGNGSKANIKLFSYDWSVGGKSGTSAMLVAVQVTELVEYNGGGVDFDVEEGGDTDF